MNFVWYDTSSLKSIAMKIIDQSLKHENGGSNACGIFQSETPGKRGEIGQDIH
jgi:hypothetical protein